MNIIKTLVRHLKNNRYSLILFFVLWLFCIASRLSIKQMEAAGIIYPFLNTALIVILLFVFSKTRLRYPVILILSLITAVDIGLLYLYETPMLYTILASISETNATEALEVANIGLIIGLISFIALSFFMYKASNELKNIKFRYSIFTSISALILFILIIPLALLMRIGYDVGTNLKNNPGITISSAVGIKYPVVINDCFLIGLYINEMIRLNWSDSAGKSLPQGITFKGNSKVNKIILIIGESSSRNNYSLYNYAQKTTPFLDSLSTTPKLHFYNEVYSPSYFTREALRLSLTFASPQNPEPFFENQSMIDMAKNAGYEISWISNHSNFGIYNSYIDQIKSAAHYSYFGKEGIQDDLKLLDYFKQRLIPDKRQFITLHIIGSHYSYKSKYDETDKEALSRDIGRNIHYDRSIHHTDRFIHQVYDLIKNLDENVVIFYYSDHGEAIKSEGYDLTELERHCVPLVVIQNNANTINPDSIILKYYNKEIGIYNTSNNIYAMSEIMGYDVSDKNVSEAQNNAMFYYTENSFKPFSKLIDSRSK